MSTFLFWLCLSSFIALAGYGVYRLVRWVIAYVAWWSSE